MKKKPLIFSRIRNIFIYGFAIYIVFIFFNDTLSLYKKKYQLRKEGITIKGLYTKKYYKKTGAKNGYNEFTYRYNWYGKIYELKDRKGVKTKVGDSVDIVISPNNPQHSAPKYWVEKSWLLPPYW